MPYIPPPCSAVNFNFSGSYSIPACYEVNFYFADAFDHNIASSNILLSLEFPVSTLFAGSLIQSSDISIALTFPSVSILPVWPIASSTVAIIPQFVTTSVRTPEPQDLPTNISISGKSYIWGFSSKVDAHKQFPFDESRIRDRRIAFPDSKFSLIDNSISISWSELPWKDNRFATPYSDFPFKTDEASCLGFIVIMSFVDDTYSFSVDGFDEIDPSTAIPYGSPNTQDRMKCASWDVPKVKDNLVSVYWNEPGGYDSHKSVAWGPFSYYTLCGLNYWEPASCSVIDFHFPNKYALVPNVCEGLTFHVNEYSTSTDPRCPWVHMHSGVRDRYPGIILDPTQPQFQEARQVYYMLNTVSVREYISQVPIEVLAVSIAIDRDSWLWQFQITVSSRNCLEVIRPRKGVFVSVIIEVNGYEWICTVENWSESRTFGKETWTVTGRSPSLIFGEPVSAKTSQTVSTGRQGQQIFDDILSVKTMPSTWPASLMPWTSDWSLYITSGAVQTGFQPLTDWYIPANTFSYTDQTEIDVLKTITTSVGAYIQTSPDANIFHVRPMYAYQPWNWVFSNANINWRALAEYQCTEIGSQHNLKPYYQAIHVMGESVASNDTGTGASPDGKAVFVDVCRTGWCGGGTASYAPAMTNSLITTVKAGAEYGRMVIGGTGEWINHTLKIGVLCPGSDATGLFTPGDMIAVLERGAPWYGQVTGVSIAVAGDGSGLFSVAQTIEVEEYVG